MFQVAEDIIDLNIGGHHITTTKKTLMRFEGSVLHAMFSGRHQLPKHDGRIFIDRDGKAFTHMINYLRTGEKPPFEEDGGNKQLVHFRGSIISEEERMFYRELQYWQIPSPENFMSMGRDDQVLFDNYVFNEFDPEWSA